MSDMLMTVQKKVKSVAEQFEGADYFYGDWNQIDELLDKIGNEGRHGFPRPIICHILPVSGTMSMRVGDLHFIDSPETIFAFLVPTDLDFDGEENEDKVELMKLLAQWFIRALNESDLFEPIGDEELTYQVPYDTTDDNVTGIILPLPLKEKQGRVFCHQPNIFGYCKEC